MAGFSDAYRALTGVFPKDEAVTLDASVKDVREIVGFSAARRALFGHS